MSGSQNHDLYINETKLIQLLKAVGEKDRDIIQSMYLLMCNTNNEREVLYNENLDGLVQIYGQERVGAILEKWFIKETDPEYELTYYIPLINILDFVDWDVELPMLEIRQKVKNNH